MTARAWAVIGAGYGDEGKGLMTDALSHALGPGALVVRTNGGAQAGHSVQLPDGRRHVFHHIGSGALAGAPTHLSRFFVHHPMVLGQEVQAVVSLGGCVSISADPRGYVTTPWDMLVNQVAERARGDGRHGSCGYGFGETVGRCQETDFRLTLADLAGPDLDRKLSAIRGEWFPARLAALDVSISEQDRALVASEALLLTYLADCSRLLERIAMRPDGHIGAAAHVVFEGAQGLMLDQDADGFPHLTRSSTGLRNMLAVAAEAGIGSIEAVYTTRCYLTRHGRGPMPNERDIAGAFQVADLTNVPNPWQESLRFGELDLDLLGNAIARDLREAKRGACSVVPHLAVTCLDQALGPIPFRRGGQRRVADERAFLSSAAEAVGAWHVATSRGPTRAAVELGGLMGAAALAA